MMNETDRPLSLLERLFGPDSVANDLRDELVRWHGFVDKLEHAYGAPALRLARCMDSTQCKAFVSEIGALAERSSGSECFSGSRRSSGSGRSSEKPIASRSDA